MKEAMMGNLGNYVHHNRKKLPYLGKYMDKKIVRVIILIWACSEHSRVCFLETIATKLPLSKISSIFPPTTCLKLSNLCIKGTKQCWSCSSIGLVVHSSHHNIFFEVVLTSLRWFKAQCSVLSGFHGTVRQRNNMHEDQGWSATNYILIGYFKVEFDKSTP